MRKYKHNGVYLDMGLGKTFVGAEQLVNRRGDKNIIICQLGKLDGDDSWLEHFDTYYDRSDLAFFNLRYDDQLDEFIYGKPPKGESDIGFINYDLIYLRPELAELSYEVMMLDESSIIKNSGFHKLSDRTKFITEQIKSEHNILLSGTPTDGRYEKLVTQVNLLGWNISEDLFWKHYVDFDIDKSEGFPIIKVHGYKRIERLKNKLSDCGCLFMKAENVVDLPEQVFIPHYMKPHAQYNAFMQDGIIYFDGEDEPLLGNYGGKKYMYLRQLCGHFNQARLNKVTELLQSTERRVVIFYNWDEELYVLKVICEKLNKPISYCNGKDEKDFTNYNDNENGVMLAQYSSGAKAYNWQQGHQMIFFTLPNVSEWFEQAKKRIHRGDQKETCFYHLLLSPSTIETEKIYPALLEKRDYTDKLFDKDYC